MTEPRSEYADESYRMLTLLAERLEDNPKFIAHLLGKHRHQEGKSREAQQEMLGVNDLGFVRLALCRRPAAEQAEFRIQCEQIARYTGADLGALVQIIRRVDAVQSMERRADPVQGTQASTAGQGLPEISVRPMMAPRVRINEPPPSYDASEADVEPTQRNPADPADRPRVDKPAQHSPDNEANPHDNPANASSESSSEPDDPVA